MYDLAVRGGTIVSGSGRRCQDLYIQDGVVASVSDEHWQARREIDAHGLYVLPGAIDGHVHFQDPGDSTREDFISGSMAAAAGGVTTVIEHTHSDPIRSVEFLRDKINLHRTRSIVDFGLAAHAWPEDAVHLEDLWRGGVQFFKIFTCTTHGVPALLPGVLLDTFKRIATFDGLALVHCEDESITAESERELRRLHRKDPGILPLWRSREAEQVASNVACQLARFADVRAIVAHVSHPAVLNHVERERRNGARLWAETCPQYLYLREAELDEFGPFRKFTPPARTERESAGLWQAIYDGSISHISSDHAPSTRQQKEQGRDDIWKCHFGLPGVQTGLSLLLHSVSLGRLSLEQVVRLVAEEPARLYRLWPQKGNLRPGAHADFVVVDLDRDDEIRNDRMLSRAGWSPYDGMHVRGVPIMTVLRGEVIARDGAVEASPGVGHFLAGPGARATRVHP